MSAAIGRARPNEPSACTCMGVLAEHDADAPVDVQNPGLGVLDGLGDAILHSRRLIDITDRVSIEEQTANGSQRLARHRVEKAAGWDQASAGLYDVYCWLPYPRYVIRELRHARRGGAVPGEGRAGA